MTSDILPAILMLNHAVTYSLFHVFYQFLAIISFKTFRKLKRNIKDSLSTAIHISSLLAMPFSSEASHCGLLSKFKTTFRIKLFNSIENFKDI